MADPSGPGAPLARPAAGPDDLARFQIHEAEHLARRWRVIAPLAIVLVALSEVAAYLTPEFPKDTFQSVSMILVLIGVWFAATRNPSRRVMGIITVLVSVTGST